MGRTVSIKLLADVAGYMSGIRRAGVATAEFNGELSKAAKGGKVEQITKATAILGAGLVGVAAGAVKMSMDFDRSMSAVSAATHASAGEMNAMRNAAIQAGKDTQYSATEAANGITELAKAGVSTADILGGGLKGALSLAAAGQLSVGEAAQTAASAMTQFRLSGDQVPHVADLLAAAAGKAQGSVHDVGLALNQSGLVAAKFGVSIEDTTGVLAEFAHAGLIGSDAGTSLKTMFLAMANPVGQTKDLMKQLGISFYDANGQFIGLSGVAQVLQLRLRSLTQEQRNQALAQIFGNDSIRAASILYEDGAQGVAKWKGAVNESGYAASTAAKLTDNLSGDLERLRGSLETVAIESGSGANAGLRNMAKGAELAVNAFAGLPGWVQQSVTVLSGIGGVSLLAAAGFLKMRGTVKDFMDELRDMGPRGAAAASGLSKVGSVAGKLGLVGLAAAGVYTGFKLFDDWAQKRTAPVKANIDALTESIKQFAQTGQATGELAAKYGDHLQKISSDVQGVIKGLSDLAIQQKLVKEGLSDPSVSENWNPVDPQALQRIKDLDTTLTALVTSGGASQAVIFLRQMQAQTGMTGTEFAKLTGMLPNYTAAAGSAAIANGGLVKGFGSAQANAKTLQGTLEATASAGQKLTDVWTQLHGALLGTDKALLAANGSIQTVKKSFQDNGKAINGNTDAALKNRIAVGDAAKAAVDAAQAKYEETGSVKQANATYNVYLDQLRKTLYAAGLNKGEVDRLLNSYAKMPPGIATKINQPGMSQAISQTQDLWTRLQGVDGNWVANIRSTGYSKVAADLRHLMAAQMALKNGTSVNEANRELGHFFAGGGWTGPGAKYKIAGIVHADEHVIRQESRRSLEAQRPGGLDYMNTTGRWPGYAGGGVVMPYPVTEAKTKIPPMAALIGAAIGGTIATGNLGAWIMQAIMLTGVPASWAGPLHTLVMRESGGNPRSINLTDSNARAGHPSQGLAQTIPSTFEHYRLGSLPDDIYNPVANLAAAIRYILSRYGTIFNVQQANANRPPKGYAHGGMITEPILGVGASGQSYMFGENYQPERVVSSWHEGGGAPVTAVTIVVENHGVIGSRLEVQNMLTSAIEALHRGGRI